MKEKNTRNVRVLLLEDSPTSYDAIKLNLETYGFEVDVTSNIAGFERIIKEKDFDVYVIDYDLPTDRPPTKKIGGGEKALDILSDSVGLVPVIIYSGVLEQEMEEAEVIEKGASFILRKGRDGSALAALIKRIIGEHDEKIGFRLKSYLSSRLNEKTFYLRLISERKEKRGEQMVTTIEAEVQRLYDKAPMVYEIKLDRKGEVLNARKTKG